MSKKRKHVKLRELEELIPFSVEVEMLTDNDLVKIINLCGDYLNIISPKDLAKRDGISSVSANKETNHRKVVKLFNTKFISEKY